MAKSCRNSYVACRMIHGTCELVPEPWHLNPRNLCEQFKPRAVNMSTAIMGQAMVKPSQIDSQLPKHEVCVAVTHCTSRLVVLLLARLTPWSPWRFFALTIYGRSIL